MRQVVNSFGATQDTREENFSVETIRGRPRVAPGFNDLHRFMHPNRPQGLKGVFQVGGDGIKHSRKELENMLGDMCLQIVRKSTLENVLVGEGLNLYHCLVFVTEN